MEPPSRPLLFLSDDAKGELAEDGCSNNSPAVNITLDSLTHIAYRHRYACLQKNLVCEFSCASIAPNRFQVSSVVW